MKASSFFTLVALPFLVFAQSPIVTTSLTTFATIPSGRTITTVTSGVLLTITPSSLAQTSTSGLSGSGSLLPSGNGTSNAVSSTPTTPQPTAPTNVYGGGNSGANGGAPVPGQNAPGGIYGPNDGYIASGIGTAANIVLGILAGVVAGGAMVLA